MQMQEPEQWHHPQSEWQTAQEYNEYQAGYAIEDGLRQQQKIYPSMERKLHKTLWIVTLILSSISFFFTVAGIVASAIVLKHAGEQGPLLAGGVIGLISSIVALLVCVAIFVITVIVLAEKTKKLRTSIHIGHVK